MPTSTKAIPVSSSTSEDEIESEYEESEKSDEESTETRRNYSKTGTTTKLDIIWNILNTTNSFRQSQIIIHEKNRSYHTLLYH
ncbi:Hypothetical predicted protein [Octopus vulgaris]|uniref:Uncharacterized protein n=1 Tax=Octopus vulgaris TaxID=6645 RepID=A0AA36BJF6_OCTVU|nr:Hypothetical predicted protein [Octopus vulgaris]